MIFRSTLFKPPSPWLLTTHRRGERDQIGFEGPIYLSRSVAPRSSSRPRCSSDATNFITSRATAKQTIMCSLTQPSEKHASDIRSEMSLFRLLNIADEEPQGSPSLSSTTGCWKSMGDLERATRKPRRKRRTSAPRGPCRPYVLEEDMYIWYFRTDLGSDWDVVLECFRNQFSEKPKRAKGGLQCRSYRVLKDWGVEMIRHQNSLSRDAARHQYVGKFGVIVGVSTFHGSLHTNENRTGLITVSLG
jgi:hypothetical protein